MGPRQTSLQKTESLKILNTLATVVPRLLEKVPAYTPPPYAPILKLLLLPLIKTPTQGCKVEAPIPVTTAVEYPALEDGAIQGLI